jgi:uncharacterized membrane protein
MVAAMVVMLAVVLPILSFVRARQARRTAAAALRRVEALEALVAQLREPAAPGAARSEIASEPEGAAAGSHPASDPHAAAIPPSPIVTPTADVRGPAAAGPTDVRGSAAAGTADVRGPAAAGTADVRGSAAAGTADVQGSAAVAAAAAAATVADRAALTATSASAPLAAPTAPTGSPATRGDLEQQIGSRWLLYAGIAAVVLGMSYFVKFAFDNGWISEPMRVAAGVATGAVLVAGGVRFWSQGLAVFGQALAGGGFVVLYVSIYAALHFYRLITPTPAFALMVLVTAGAAWLADRQRSQSMATLALIGGFATPLLIGGRGAQLVLFTYIAILITGSAALARRHLWPLLAAVSYLCTFGLLLTWFFASYEAGDWLRTELFLTFYAVVFAYLLGGLLASGDRSAGTQLAIAALATAPLAYHLASIVLLNGHPAAWLVYITLATVAGLVVSHRAGAAWLRVAVLVLIGIPALVWLNGLQHPRWYAESIVTMFVIYALHLVAQWGAERRAGDPGLPLVETIHAQLNGLLLPLTLYLFLETRFAAWNPWMAAGLSAWNALLAAAARQHGSRMALQFLALGATLAAAALVLAFDGPAVAAGWAAEGVLVAWLALRERSRALAVGGGVLIAMGSSQLARLLASPLPIGDTPLLNARALAAVVVIGLLAWLASRMRDTDDMAGSGRARDAVIVLANLMALVVLSSEIHAYFDHRAVHAGLGGGRQAPASAGLAGPLALSVTWALYAVALIAAGIRRGYAPARYLAIALFGVTIAKLLLHDIAGLDRFNRMLAVLGVGVLLLVGSYLYQRRSSQDPGRRDTRS